MVVACSLQVLLWELRFLKPSFDSQLEILDMYGTGRDNQLKFLSILSVSPWKILFFYVDTISKMLAWNILVVNQNLDLKKKKSELMNSGNVFQKAVIVCTFTLV